MELGLVHLYWGEGKGKTTAAMGLALRALGNGCRVVIVQFLKGADTGEVPLLRQLGAEIYRGKAGARRGRSSSFRWTRRKRPPPAPCRTQTSPPPWPARPTC